MVSKIILFSKHWTSSYKFILPDEIVSPLNLEGGAALWEWPKVYSLIFITNFYNTLT